MSITHLLKNTLEIYYPVNTIDAVGGHSTNWYLDGTYPCRIEQLLRDREVILGRDNTQATHRIYLTPEVYSHLNYDRIVKVNNKTFEIVDFEDLDPIITNCRVLHIELYVKWAEHQFTDVVASPPPVAVIGSAIVGN